MKFAPILIMVYTRKNHFINCIESLSRCRLADRSHLFIASDGPKTSLDAETVKEIRDYCVNISGFDKIELLAPEKNLGVVENFNKAMARVFFEYDRFIFSEDDNIFAPNFLEYMNEGLTFYQNDSRVFSICGYKHPFKMPKNYPYSVFSSTIISAWGFGLWKDKYDVVDLYPKDYQKYKNTKKMSITFRLIMESVGSTKFQGDAIYEYHCLKNNMVNIFPCVSLVRNHGSDGSGAHLRICKKYDAQEISDGKEQIVFIKDKKPFLRLSLLLK